MSEHCIAAHFFSFLDLSAPADAFKPPRVLMYVAPRDCKSC